MMKRLLFTSAIALFSVVSFAQNGNYNSQRDAGTMTSQGSYQRGATGTTPKSSTQPVTQQPGINYNQNGGGYKQQQNSNGQDGYNKTQQNGNSGYGNGGNYQGGNHQPVQQPSNNYNQSREYDNHQAPQRQPEFGYDQRGNDRRYVPIYHQPPFRRDYRYEQHRGHDHFDARGNYWY